MEPKFQSSFIPKGPIAASPLGAQYAKPKATLFGFIATLVFVLTLILSVGVFAYDRYLLSSIGTMGDQLTSARATMQPDTINELVTADKRLQGTRLLLAQHTALSPFFDFLESATLKNVRYTEFLYTADSGGYEVSMQGQARSYQDVASQSDAFNRSGVFRDPVFSNLDLDAKGNVTFAFHATIDPSLVSYEKLLEGQPVSAPVVAATSTAAVATTTVKTVTASSSQATSTKPAAH
jgi:hypothetical protein